MPCSLEYTDDRFIFAGRSYQGVPLLVDSENRFVVPVCDYLRNLVTYDRLKTSSAKTYAEYILHFWNYLDGKKLDYRDISDKNLIEWLNKQEGAGVSGMTQAARCDAVFALYVWLESHGYVQHMVRIPGFNDNERFYPKLMSVVVKGSPSHRRASKHGIACAVRPRSVASVQATPTASDLTSIYIAADNPGNPSLTERNHLLIDWYSQVGLRRKEWSALTIEQIPGWDAIDTMRASNEAHELRLTVTKGDRHRHVGVLPELLERTREYIEGPRAEVVARFRRNKIRHYREPKEVFLSEKTGVALGLTTITNLLTGWFKASGVEGHGHRLRASYLTNLFEAELVAEESRLIAHPDTKVAIDYELILRKVADRAGHANIESLRPYLTLARKRRARDSGGADLVTLQQQVEARRQELALLEHRVNKLRAELQLPPKRVMSQKP